MIRVLQVVTDMSMGGIEMLLMNLYRNIDRELVQFDFLMHRAKESHFDKEILSLGGRIYRVPSIHPFHHRAYLKALERFFEEHPDYRVIHAHNNAFSMYVLRAAKGAGVPVCIAHSHMSDVPFDFKRTLFTEYCKLHILKYTDYPFACSERAGKWLFGDNIQETIGLHVFKNGIDVEKFKFNPDKRKSVRKALNIDSQLLIGHIGRFHPVKNHRFLIGIFAEVCRLKPESMLLLIGEGGRQQDVSAHVEQLNLQTKVRFLGIRDDVNDLLQALDMFVLPSLNEGLPVTLVEAQASGLPCLVSDAVTDEVRITDNVAFMPLDLPAAMWAEKALDMTKHHLRRDTSEDIIKAGYDIKENAAWLQNFYLEKHNHHA